MLLAFGLLGYGLRRYHYPIAPVVVGLILGPLAEQQLRRALAISQGDPSVLVHSPVAIMLYADRRRSRCCCRSSCGCAARARCWSSWPPTRTEGAHGRWRSATTAPAARPVARANQVSA